MPPSLLESRHRSALADRVLRWLLPCVGIAAVLGGAVFWARRVGWLQAERYWHEQQRLVAWASTQHDAVAASELVLRFNNSLHDGSGGWWIIKLPKELVLVSFVLIALAQWRPQRSAAGLAHAGLLLLAAVSALLSILAGRWLELVAGARSFLPWLLGASAAGITRDTLLRALAKVLLWTLLVEGVLVAIELRQGLLIYSMVLFGGDSVRAVGSFNLPISLGCFSVVSWAVILCWGQYPRMLAAALTALVLALLVVTASGAAWLAFGVAVAVLVFAQRPLHVRIAMLVCMLPLTIAAWFGLPQLTGRPDLHDSLWGRIHPVQAYASAHLSVPEMLFGSGFGHGTNAHAQLAGDTTVPINASERPVGDSLPAVLFWQVGLLGLLIAYALMLAALRADPRSAAIGAALLVASVAVNITELFPLNLVLGLWLAHALRSGHQHARND